MNRIRVGFSLTIIGGFIWAAAGLFDSLAHFAAGVIVSMVGIIGYGLVDWIDYERAERLRQYRAEVWHRRDLDAARESQLPTSKYTRDREAR